MCVYMKKRERDLRECVKIEMDRNEEIKETKTPSQHKYYK